MLTEQNFISGVRTDEEGKALIANPAKREFIVNSSSHYIHLDGCCAAKRISPAHIGTAEKPTKKHKLCAFCRNRLLLSLGASEEDAPLEEYADFFRRCGLPWANFERLFLFHNAKMARLSRDVVMFRVREDFWKVILFDNGSLLIMHNNYTVRNGLRCFYAGFHPQHRPFFGEPEKAFRTMTHYSWKAHIEWQRRGKVKVQTREKISFSKDAGGFSDRKIPKNKQMSLNEACAAESGNAVSEKRSSQPPLWDELPKDKYNGSGKIQPTKAIPAAACAKPTESAPAAKRSGPPPTWDELPKTYTERRKRSRSGKIKFRAPVERQLQTV